MEKTKKEIPSEYFLKPDIPTGMVHVPAFLAGLGDRFHAYVSSGDLVLIGNPEAILAVLHSDGPVSHKTGIGFKENDKREIVVDFETAGRVLIKGEALRNFLDPRLDEFERNAIDSAIDDDTMWSRYGELLFCTFFFGVYPETLRSAMNIFKSHRPVLHEKAMDGRKKAIKYTQKTKRSTGTRSKNS